MDPMGFTFIVATANLLVLPVGTEQTNQPDIKKGKTKLMYLLPLAAVLQDTGGVIDGSIVFTDRQVRALMLVHLDHEVVVLQL